MRRWAGVWSSQLGLGKVGMIGSATVTACVLVFVAAEVLILAVLYLSWSTNVNHDLGEVSSAASAPFLKCLNV